MEALAESGHICLAEHTARLVEGYFQLQDLGRTKVKGVGEPVGLFDLEGWGRFAPASTDRAHAASPSSSAELREAHRLFTEIGAPIRAAEVAKELGS
jgi:hypothetical protein